MSPASRLATGDRRGPSRISASTSASPIDCVTARPTRSRPSTRVDFDLLRGEILGLVGESGSGKTTLAMTLMRLTEPTSGEIHFDGIDLTAIPRSDLRRLRSRMQMILQDATAVCRRGCGCGTC